MANISQSGDGRDRLHRYQDDASAGVASLGEMKLPPVAPRRTMQVQEDDYARRGATGGSFISQQSPARRIANATPGLAARAARWMGQGSHLHAPPMTRLILAVSGAALGLGSAWITQAELSPASGNYQWIGWLVVLLISSVEFGWLYVGGGQVAGWVVRLLMVFDVWINTMAIHKVYGRGLDIVSANTWAYILIGAGLALLPEVFLKVAATGKVVE